MNVSMATLRKEKKTWISEYDKDPERSSKVNNWASFVIGRNLSLLFTDLVGVSGDHCLYIYLEYILFTSFDPKTNFIVNQGLYDRWPQIIIKHIKAIFFFRQFMQVKIKLLIVPTLSCIDNQLFLNYVIIPVAWKVKWTKKYSNSIARLVFFYSDCVISFIAKSNVSK